MAAGYVYSTLLSAIRRRVRAPNATAAGTADADLVELADAETLTGIIPALTRVHEEYGITYKDITLVSGQRNYRIPTRAVGGRIRMVALVNTAGDVLWVHRNSIEQQEVSPAHYFIQGNEIWLNGNPTNTTDTLRVYFQIRPSKLVSEATSVVAVVSSFVAATKTITTTTTIPSTITTSVLVDVVKATAGFDCLAIDQVLTTASSTTLVFSSALPTHIAAGDYVCLTEQTPVPQMPAELHPLLAQMVVEAVCEANGNSEGLANAANRRKKMESDIYALLTPRAESDPAKLVSRNPLFSATQPTRIVRSQ